MADLAQLRQAIAATAKKKTAVSMANSAWHDSAYTEFRKEYLQSLENAFDASMYPVRFENSSEVAGRINRWVSEKTKGRIKEVLSPQDFVPTPALVLVNAVYFKSDWGSPFEETGTQEYPFHLNAKTMVDALLMHQCSHFRYGENRTFQFLELPYVDGKYTMCVLLPKQLLSPKKLVSMVQPDTLATLGDSADYREVDVLLPKGEVRSHYDARNTLSQMGVALAFDPERADFRRMTTSAATPLYLSRVYHDAWVAMDEKGTEAAAATTIVAAPACAPPEGGTPPVVFHADHPFLFFIVHNDSRSILFAGLMANPKGLAGDFNAK